MVFQNKEKKTVSVSYIRHLELINLGEFKTEESTKYVK